jgi:hypothetical protein
MLARVPSMRQKRFAELRRFGPVSSFQARHVRTAASMDVLLTALPHYSQTRENPGRLHRDLGVAPQLFPIAALSLTSLP